MRIGEALGLRWCDCDFEEGIIDVKTAQRRERDRRQGSKKKFVVDGYTDFVFFNSNGQVYTQSFIYDAIQGITTSYNKEESAKAYEKNDSRATFQK